MREWIAWRGPKIDWLFCPIYQGKPVNRGLEKKIAKRFVQDAPKRVGLDPAEVEDFRGHSMRVGAAQDLLQRGLDAAAIMRAGGWNSVNILARYIEQAQQKVWA